MLCAWEDSSGLDAALDLATRATRPERGQLELLAVLRPRLWRRSRRADRVEAAAALERAAALAAAAGFERPVRAVRTGRFDRQVNRYALELEADVVVAARRRSRVWAMLSGHPRIELQQFGLSWRHGATKRRPTLDLTA